MKNGTIFWRDGERWFKATAMREVRMAELAPHLEADWMRRHPEEVRNAGLGWRRFLRGAEGAQD